MPITFAQLYIDIPLISANENDSALAGNWLPHFNSNGYEGDWTVLTLRSPEGSYDNIFAELNGKSGFKDTSLMDHYPAIKHLCSTLQCELKSVRLLNLKAGAIIKQHRDNELAFEKGEARLHFPVQTNENVEFYVNDTRLTMLPGECWYINANLPHRVANYGTTDRIHLVIDCKVNNWLQDVFENAEKSEYEEPFDAEQTAAVIKMLRSHQTETANKLADSMQIELDNYLTNLSALL